MDQGFRLLGYELAHFGVAVPECVDGDAGGEVEVAPVFNVPEVGPEAFGHDGWGADVGCNHVGRMG